MNLKAYYDIDNDTIHNCQEGSYEWYHEKIHQEQFTQMKSIKWLYYMLLFGMKHISPIFYVAFVIACFFNYQEIFIFILGAFWHIAYCSFVVILEIDALLRGTLKWLQKKK